MTMETPMPIATTIQPPQWMTDPSTQTIMNILNHDGQNALFVGGCVRNALLNEPVFDIDIACKFTPQHTMELLKHHNVHVVDTGIKFGTITAIKSKKSFEITSLRSDLNPTGRHSDVIFNESWKKDAQRRDFTINALYADTQGNIFAPLNHSLPDIKSRTVRFIGDPTTRIQEDHLRILRFFRFSAKFGSAADHPSLTACTNNAHLIHKLSSERIFDETLKILKDDSAPKALTLIQQANIFPVQDQEINTLSNLIALQNAYKKTDTTARISTLSFIKKYIKNKKIGKFIKKIDEFIKGNNTTSQSLYKYDRDTVIQGIMIQNAKNGTQNNTDIENAINTPVPIIPFQASDIMNEFQLEPDPIVGEYFRQAEQIWLDSDCTMTKASVFNAMQSRSKQTDD